MGRLNHMPPTFISTTLLRLAILVISTIVALLCIFVLPLMWREAYLEFPSAGYTVRAIVIGLYLGAIPFYFALYKAMSILKLIDKGRAFSKTSAKDLQQIALCGLVISVIFVCLFPFFFILGDQDDAPGLIVICMLFVGASLTVSLFASLMQRILLEAIHYKKENELTV